MVIEIGMDNVGPNEALGNPEIQFAVYSWNGTNCTGIGGGPTSDPANTTTYYGCENGVGTVVYSNTLPPGQYVLAMNGYSLASGNSLYFWNSSSFLMNLQLLESLLFSFRQ